MKSCLIESGQLAQRVSKDKEHRKAGLRLGPALNRNHLFEVERQLHLNHSKWHTQIGDVNTLFEHPVLIGALEWDLCAGLPKP